MTKPQEFYNLDDLTQGIQRTLAPGMETRIFAGDQAMLSVVSLEANAEGQIHEHPEEQWGVMLEGSGIRIQDGEEISVKAGDFWRTPGQVPHGFKAGSNGARILDIFSPPRKDYKKSGSGFASENPDRSEK